MRQDDRREGVSKHSRSRKSTWLYRDIEEDLYKRHAMMNLDFKKWLSISRGLFSFRDETTSPKRYRVLRRNMMVLGLLGTIVPLFLMAFINFLQYRSTLKSETINPLYVLANKTKHSFELFLEERLSTVKFIASAYTFDELSDERTLNRIFRVLKQEFGGFVDLGLINSAGDQVSYAGPYAFLGKNYSEHQWFQEVVVKGEFISDVFLGYRQFPHIAIAVQHLTEEGGYWILRATIDTKKFDLLIASMGLDRESDAYLINHAGTFQTNSRFYGKVLEQCPFSIPQGTYGTYVTEEIDPQNQEVLLAYTHFIEPDYTLVIVKPRSFVLRSWYTLKSELFYIFIVSVGLLIIGVFKLTDVLVKRVKEADEKREVAFREVQHTHKLSSIGRLAAGVAHEINNPLAIINEKAGLMKDLIESDFEDRNRFLALVGSILQSVERCRAVTHRLLGFARRMEVQFEMINLNELIEEVLGFLEKEMLYRNIDFRLQLSEELPPLSSDRSQIQQVFLNILTNALAAVDDGGQITVTTWENDSDTICASFQDNGCGMSKKTLSHIFEPFFTTKKEYGTGLGLSITYGIVQKLGGNIHVESEEGQGATFTVSLPKSPKEESGA